jgi:hypothetical protein
LLYLASMLTRKAVIQVLGLFALSYSAAAATRSANVVRKQNPGMIKSAHTVRGTNVVLAKTTEGEPRVFRVNAGKAEEVQLFDVERAVTEVARSAGMGDAKLGDGTGNDLSTLTKNGIRFHLQGRDGAAHNYIFMIKNGRLRRDAVATRKQRAKARAEAAAQETARGVAEPTVAAEREQQSDTYLPPAPAERTERKPTYEEISNLAYRLWEESGRPAGTEDANWQKAERLLTEGMEQTQEPQQ